MNVTTSNCLRQMWSIKRKSIFSQTQLRGKYRNVFSFGTSTYRFSETYLPKTFQIQCMFDVVVCMFSDHCHIDWQIRENSYISGLFYCWYMLQAKGHKMETPLTKQESLYQTFRIYHKVNLTIRGDFSFRTICTYCMWYSIGLSKDAES